MTTPIVITHPPTVKCKQQNGTGSRESSINAYNRTICTRGDHGSYVYNDKAQRVKPLRKCILKGPYTPTTIVVPVIPATKNSPAVPEQTTIEIVLNMSPANKAHFESEKEAIHLILTGIGRLDIYSTI
ncbi:hypothetical protein Tco_0673748 [Tanacetum coccineum]